MLVNFSECCHAPAFYGALDFNKVAAFICSDCDEICNVYAKDPNVKTCPECSNEITYKNCTCKEQETI